MPSPKQELLNRLKAFKYSYMNSAPHHTGYAFGTWKVRTWDGLRIPFPHNPFLAVFECHGYLRQGAWTLEPGMTVVDAGACFGEFAIYAAHRVGPTGRVIVLEPDPDNIEIFNKALAAQPVPLTNVTLLKSGLWSSRDSLEFAAEGGAGSSLLAGGKDRSHRPAAEIIRIDVLGLQDIVDDLGLDRLDFVKMDIEGAEIESCSAATDLLKRMKTRLAIASYHNRDGKKTAELLVPMFKEAGMQADTGFPQHLTTYAWTDGSA